MLAVAHPPLLLGILGAVVLVLGLVAVIVLAVYVIKRAPPDGSDIGRDPRLQGDEHKRRNGAGSGARRP
jgi:hypothetical protein